MKKILTTLLGMTMIANSSVVVSCDWNDRGDIVVGGDIVVDFYENGFEQLGTYFPPIEIDKYDFANTNFADFVDANWTKWRDGISTYLDKQNRNQLRYSFDLKKENISYKGSKIIIQLDAVTIEKEGFGKLNFNIDLYDDTISDDDLNRIQEIVDAPVPNEDSISLDKVFTYLNNPLSSRRDIFIEKENEIYTSIFSAVTVENTDDVEVNLSSIEITHDPNNWWKQTFLTTAKVAFLEQHFSFELQTTQEYKQIATTFSNDATGNLAFLRTTWNENMKGDDQKSSEIDEKCDELGSSPDVNRKKEILKEFIQDIFAIDTSKLEIQLSDDGIWDISSLSEIGILPFYNGNTKISEIKL